MYRRILVPTDGSQLASEAIPYARLAAQVMGARLELFQAVPGMMELMRSHGMTGDSLTPVAVHSYEDWEGLRDRTRREAEGYLQREAASLSRGGSLAVEVGVGEGSPAGAIVAEAEAEPDTLVVMSTHGRAGLGRWLTGSVTDAVVHRSSVPVLVIRPREVAQAQARREPHITRVVLPLDDSELAQAAIPHAVAWAKALNARVELLRAYSSGFWADRAVLPNSGPRKAVRYHLESVASDLRGEGIRDVEIMYSDQDPGEAIVQVGQGPESLVVMSTHGRSGLSRSILGSVASHVIRNSDGPVLVIRPQQEG